VKIDHYGETRDGISVATLAESGFAYMKKFGATKVSAEPGKPQGYEETGSVSSTSRPRLRGRVVERAQPHLRDGGRRAHRRRPSRLRHRRAGDGGAAVRLRDAPEYRALVKREFATTKALFGEYQKALEKTYAVPKVPEPK
jgi:hypothetical protein